MSLVGSAKSRITSKTNSLLVPLFSLSFPQNFLIFSIVNDIFYILSNFSKIKILVPSSIKFPTSRSLIFLIIKN